MRSISAIPFSGSATIPIRDPFVQDAWLGLVRSAAAAGLALAAPFIVLQIAAFMGAPSKGRITWTTFSVPVYFGGALISWLFLPYVFPWFRSGSLRREDLIFAFSEAMPTGFKIMAAAGLCLQLPYIALTLGKLGILKPDTVRVHRVSMIALALFASAVVVPHYSLSHMLDGAVFFYLLLAGSLYAARRLSCLHAGVETITRHCGI